MSHKNSKCIFFHHGMVLDEACDKTIATCFCDLDVMEDDKPCTADACYYYSRGNEEGDGFSQKQKENTMEARKKKQEGMCGNCQHWKRDKSEPIVGTCPNQEGMSAEWHTGCPHHKPKAKGNRK